VISKKIKQHQHTGLVKCGNIQMNLSRILFKSKIDSLGFDTVYVEKPMSNLVDFDWKKILKAPRDNSSSDTIKELHLISKVTSSRNQKDIELIHNIDQDIHQPFINLLKQYNLKYPQNYIQSFYDIVKPVLLNTKSYWNRPRPKQLADMYDIDIKIILTDTIHSASYPSGHTVYSSLVANILRDIYPQIVKKELDNIVLQTAKARVLQGVHYPTDNKASIIFSKFIFDNLNPKLRKLIQ